MAGFLGVDPCSVTSWETEQWRPLKRMRDRPYHALCENNDDDRCAKRTEPEAFRLCFLHGSEPFERGGQPCETRGEHDGVLDLFIICAGVFGLRDVSNNASLMFHGNGNADLYQLHGLRIKRSLFIADRPELGVCIPDFRILGLKIVEELGHVLCLSGLFGRYRLRKDGTRVRVC